jgi:hypothetical protein
MVLNVSRSRVGGGELAPLLSEALASARPSIDDGSESLLAHVCMEALAEASRRLEQADW